MFGIKRDRGSPINWLFGRLWLSMRSIEAQQKKMSGLLATLVEGNLPSISTRPLKFASILTQIIGCYAQRTDDLFNHIGLADQ